MARLSLRSISLPIVLGSITVALSIALLVGWTLLLVRSLSLSREVAENVSLLVAGIVSFAVIMSAAVLLSAFLVREIRVVHRQQAFIDSVTHELKSPLASIKLGLETLARAGLSGEQREELRRMMLGDVDRLATFIDDILEASRISHGRRTYVLGEVELSFAARHVARAVERRHGLEEGSIGVSVPDGLCLYTDTTALETILKNLVDNAVKYSPAPPTVSIVASGLPRERVELLVRDRGIGIPRRELRRIFERFYRVPGAEVYARHGSGLGLFLVASLARSLGGEIQASSPGVGQGTTMRLVMPRRLSREPREASE